MKRLRMCVAVTTAVGLISPLLGTATAFPASGRDDTKVSASGVSIRVPAGWTRTAHAVTSKDGPDLVLSIGTKQQVPAIDCRQPLQRGTALMVYEYPPTFAGSEFPRPGLTPEIVPGGFPRSLLEPRPSDFTQPIAGSSEALLVCGGDEQTPARFVEQLFSDQGRTFLARVVTVGEGTRMPQAQRAFQALNTLKVKPY